MDKAFSEGTHRLLVSFLFRTSEGGAGVLQITTYTENPHGLKIRYKLVQEPDQARKTSSSSNNSNPPVA